MPEFLPPSQVGVFLTVRTTVSKELVFLVCAVVAALYAFEFHKIAVAVRRFFKPSGF
jgi:hypothetical protein